MGKFQVPRLCRKRHMAMASPPPDDAAGRQLPTQQHWFHTSTPDLVSDSGFIPSGQLMGLLCDNASAAAFPPPTGDTLLVFV